MMKAMWMPYLILATGVMFLFATFSSVEFYEPWPTTIQGPGDGDFPSVQDDHIFEEPVQDCGRLAYFSNMTELKEYLGIVNGSDGQRIRRPTPPSSGSSADLTTSGGSTHYSQTNVQVAGIDEDDIVKTDGEYIYTISGREIVILRAYPPDQATVLSRIPLWSWSYGLFVDADRLVLIAGDYYNYHSYWSSKTYVLLYDVSDRSAPNLLRNISVSGPFVGSRLYNNFVYIVTTSSVLTYKSQNGYRGYDVQLPEIEDNAQTTILEASQLGYFKDQPVERKAVTILALRTSGDQEPSIVSFLVGEMQKMYVSTDHMFVAGLVYRLIPQGNTTVSSQRTAVHKISFFDGEVRYLCSGEVPGRLISQFAMDEYRRNLRVVTTEGRVSRNGNGDANNNVYILNVNMEPIGAVEDLAPGERLHSVRFLGNRVYFVTFKKVDPFFVVDLSNPTSPRVLGYLKIPGFSEYLHMLDENHVIGIGKDTVEADGGSFAWFQGLKLSLFDVTDAHNPVEVSKFNIGDRGTYSEVLYNHRALLIDLERGLLALPVLLAEINRSMYPSDVPLDACGETVWQGLYIFSVSVEHGFVLQGRVTHDAEPSYSYWYYWGDGQKSRFVRRGLYIEDVLYTISDAMVKMNRLADLSEIGLIEL